MSALEVLRRLDDLGVALTLSDGRLRYRGRGEELPSELLTQMKRHRADLVGLVGGATAWPGRRRPEGTQGR